MFEKGLTGINASVASAVNSYPVCGDGKIEGNEVCDKTAGCSMGKVCSADCKSCITPPADAGSPCGNGKPDPGEECDDGDKNGTDWSSCTKDCKKVDHHPGPAW